MTLKQQKVSFQHNYFWHEANRQTLAEKVNWCKLSVCELAYALAQLKNQRLAVSDSWLINTDHKTVSQRPTAGCAKFLLAS